jgi:hypothetical protein
MSACGSPTAPSFGLWVCIIIFPSSSIHIGLNMKRRNYFFLITIALILLVGTTYYIFAERFLSVLRESGICIDVYITTISTTSSSRETVIHTSMSLGSFSFYNTAEARAVSLCNAFTSAIKPVLLAVIGITLHAVVGPVSRNCRCNPPYKSEASNEIFCSPKVGSLLNVSQFYK